jgi:hypothetical protein
MSEEQVIVKIEPTELEAYVIREGKAYSNDMGLVEKFIRTSEPYRFCLLDAYRQFQSQNKLIPIEKLDQDTKKELFQHSLRIEPNEISDVLRRNICRCIWLFNFVFEKYFV